MSHICWDFELVRRYRSTEQPCHGGPGRTQLHDGVGSFELLHALRGSRQQRRPLALHVHLPFCTSACRHCQRVLIHDSGTDQAWRYLELLELEIERLGCHLDPGQRVHQLHISGGSPTALGHAWLRRLMNSLRQHFNLSSSVTNDFAIEVDPQAADWSDMGELLELGFNRITLRVDDLNPEVQTAINRRPSLASTRTLVEAAHTLQFRSVTIELMRGLPGQTAEGFAQSLEQIIALQPDRLSLPEYHHRPQRFPNQRQIDATQLPDASEKLKILQRSVERVQQAGYGYIGMDLFALPDDDLAAAQEEGVLQLDPRGFSIRGESDLIGLGVSAISRIGAFYSQNYNDLERYRCSLTNDQLPTWRGLACDAEERLQQAISQQLICNRQLCFATLEQRFGLNLPDRFADIWSRLEQMATDGLIELWLDRLRLTDRGVLLTDTVCRLFRNSQARPPAAMHATSSR